MMANCLFPQQGIEYSIDYLFHFGSNIDIITKIKDLVVLEINQYKTKKISCPP